jgi:hypothetical protein
MIPSFIVYWPEHNYMFTYISKGAGKFRLVGICPVESWEFCKKERENSY